MSTQMTMRTAAIPRYGPRMSPRSRSFACTSSEPIPSISSSGVSPGRMSTAPMSTPMLAPTGLKHWARLSRWVALPRGPIARTNGLAEATCWNRPTCCASRECC